MSAPNTDYRILAVLRSGDMIRGAVDPDGLLCDTRIAQLSLAARDGGFLWSLLLNCTSGDSVILSGGAAETFVINEIVLRSGKDEQKIHVETAGTLSVALGSLSGLPDDMKRNLAFSGQAGHVVSPCVSGGSLFGLLHEALMNGVEGAENKSLTGKFNKICVSFDNSAGGICFSARISSAMPVLGGRIVVGVDVDVYGLKGKRVIFSYSFGMGRTMEADCFVVEQFRRRPSLKLALDLAGNLDGLYCKQRRKKKDMGKPKACK